MEKKGIDQRYTEKITELIAQGYQIYTGTMSGTQGEIAKVDLRKGTEIRRVLLVEGYDDDEIAAPYLAIIVGTAAANGRRIWNDRLEVVSEERFYE